MRSFAPWLAPWLPCGGLPCGGLLCGCLLCGCLLCGCLLCGCLLCGCHASAPGESSLEQCSNGRDDDADGAIDCADLACRIYVFCAGDAGPPDADPRDAAPPPDGARCTRRIDVVLVVDVSSSMLEELARLRDASDRLWDGLTALDPEARISVIVFVDDVLALRGCAPFADAAALAAEIEAWRVRAPQNRSPVSGMLNVDCPENALDALVEATRCPWREGAARLVLLVTDDTFAERPSVLSGPWGGGIVVQHTYAETADALEAADARVLALTRTGPGLDCGAGRSEDVGRGFHGPYMGMPSLPERTGGVAIDLDAWRAGSVDLAREIERAAEAACR